jgi:hypothetical protein
MPRKSHGSSAVRLYHPSGRWRNCETRTLSDQSRFATPNENGIPALLETWKAYKATGFQNPPGPEANILLGSNADEPACWWASIDRIAESGYNLSAAPYKPSIPTRANSEDPLELVDQLLKLESSITTGLQELRKQLA